MLSGLKKIKTSHCRVTSAIMNVTLPPRPLPAPIPNVKNVFCVVAHFYCFPVLPHLRSHMQGSPSVHLPVSLSGHCREVLAVTGDATHRGGFAHFTAQIRHSGQVGYWMTYLVHRRLRCHADEVTVDFPHRVPDEEEPLLTDRLKASFYLTPTATCRLSAAHSRPALLQNRWFIWRPDPDATT